VDEHTRSAGAHTPAWKAAIQLALTAVLGAVGLGVVVLGNSGVDRGSSGDASGPEPRGQAAPLPAPQAAARLHETEFIFLVASHPTAETLNGALAGEQLVRAATREAARHSHVLVVLDAATAVVAIELAAAVLPPGTGLRIVDLREAGFGS
jgi:hypothetical protein